jgi:hypothetical protein
MMSEIRSGWWRCRDGERVFVYQLPKDYDNDEKFISLSIDGNTVFLNRYGRFISDSDSDHDLIDTEPSGCDSFDWQPPKKSDGELLRVVTQGKEFCESYPWKSCNECDKAMYEKQSAAFLAAIKERDGT